MTNKYEAMMVFSVKGGGEALLQLIKGEIFAVNDSVCLKRKQGQGTNYHSNCQKTNAAGKGQFSKKGGQNNTQIPPPMSRNIDIDKQWRSSVKQ